MVSDKECIKQIISEDSWMMEILKCARDLDLPDWMIGAGFVRNKIWDYLHNYSERTTSEDMDVDLIYFNPKNKNKSQEKIYERDLRLMKDANWSVKNQSRMSEKYKSSEDAISYWPEICTCIAVKMAKDGKLELIAPFGIDDIINLVVRKNQKFSDDEEYRNRIMRKQWRERWPKLKII